MKPKALAELAPAIAGTLQQWIIRKSTIERNNHGNREKKKLDPIQNINVKYK